MIPILLSIQFKLGNKVTQWGGENFISGTLACRLLQSVIRSWTEEIAKEKRGQIKEMFKNNDRTLSLINMNKNRES